MDVYVCDSDSDAGSGNELVLVGKPGLAQTPAEQRHCRLTKELAEIEKQIMTLKRRRYTVLKSIEQTQQQIDASARIVQTRQNEKLKVGYDGAEFEWSTKVRSLLHSVFKLQSFRDNQEAIINATLDGRDVIVIMPTGGGKSLCYQLPALASPGLTLVISPLIALMDDQVMQLKDIGVAAEALTSESPNATEIKAMLRSMTTQPLKRRRANSGGTDGATANELRLLYVSPEKIVAAKQLLALIEKIHAAGKLSRIVIDECHCASEYGNDFRPDYKKLGMLKYMFPKVPVLALSATCPPRVLESVRKILGIEGGAERPSALVYTSPLWRQNLRYSVERKVDNLSKQRIQLIEWITQHHPGDRGIVYCATKNDAYEVACALHDNDVKKYTVGLYYGNLEREKKEQLHEMWRRGSVQIIVATNAFGMGINSLDVRFVAHFTAPKTIENYYQESGRAGRDGRPADCVMFYRSMDSSKIAGWGFDSQALDGLAKARAIIEYAECRHVCRKVLLQSYLQDVPIRTELMQTSFNEPDRKVARVLDRASVATLTSTSDIGTCGACDMCLKQPHAVAIDCTSAAITMINIINASGEQRMTLSRMYKLFRGYGLDATPGIAALPDLNLARFVPMSQNDVGFIVRQLITMGVLAETFGHSGYATNAYLDIADRYRYVIGHTVDQTHELGPFMVKFTADAPPKGLSVNSALTPSRARSPALVSSSDAEEG